MASDRSQLSCYPLKLAGTCWMLQLQKDDVVEGVAKIGDHALPPPRYFRGDARRVLPLMQASAAKEQGPIKGDACVTSHML